MNWPTVSGRGREPTTGERVDENRLHAPTSARKRGGTNTIRYAAVGRE